MSGFSDSLSPVDHICESVFVSACPPVCLCAQGSLLITSGFSLYLGNVFPVAMDYLRCAAGSVSDHRNHGRRR